MRHVYAVEYPLRETPPVDAVARLWHSWIADRRSGVRLPRGLDSSPAVELPSTAIGKDQTLEQIRTAQDGVVQFGVRWEHPDNRTHGIRWRTELCYATPQGDGRAKFSCKLAYGRATNRIAPTRRLTTRPRIVLRMLEKFPGIDGEALTARPAVLRFSDTPHFAAFLINQDRRRPVVLVSCRFFDDRPAINPASIGDLLAGLAHTYVADGRWPTLALRDYLPNHLVCRDGAVRIYWPGFSATGNGYGHPFWTPNDMRYLDSQGGGGLPQMLLEQVVEAAVYTAGAHEADWHRFESARRHAQMAESRAAGDFERLAESYAAENDSLRQQSESFEEQLRSAGDELRQSKNEAKYWRTMYDTAKAGESEPTQSDNEVGSVGEALDRAISQSSGRLVEALNAASDRDTPFAAPDEVYKALCFLATTYHDSKTGATPCPDLDHTLRERTGWTYEANQSSTTMGKHKSEYECTWEGRRYSLKAHIGTGTSMDARYTIRVAFAWDEKRDAVVIGYVGQHQSSDKTS